MQTVFRTIHRTRDLIQSIKHHHTRPISVSWKKPEIGWKKLNFDGSCNLIQSIKHHHTQPISVSWEKPEIGWKKLNFDGSCKCVTGKATVGGVLRDHNAEFLFGFAESIGKSTSTVAEFAALKRGLELVLENGYSNDGLWVEGDYKALVEIILLQKDVKCVEVQKEVCSINLLLCEFRKFLVTHVYREGNRVAHVLAKIGHRLERPKIWHVAPSEVVGIMNEDANGKVVIRRR